MMKPVVRWAIVAVVGVLLLVSPTLLRLLQHNPGQPNTYTSPSVPTPAIAVTPVPTPTPIQLVAEASLPDNETLLGPVVVDLAHYSLVERDKFQPLAAALAAHGVDLRFWLPTVDLNSIEQITDFPDQSTALAAQLADASALVVISPFFLYSQRELAVLQRFVADGGRLLIISDPDVGSDAARDTNVLSAPFNIVFSEDYLYDTVDNDENFTHFFLGEFYDEAAPLNGSRIAFYGGRSIGGAMVPQARSSAMTLSSLRGGRSGFTTVALGGQPANNSVGRVLAMSDFDVLTDPYVDRHDNRRMLDFVAAFLAGAERNNTIVDFPAFLGKEVALVVDSTQPINAQRLSKSAELQRFLEVSGRTLQLAPLSWLTPTVPAPAVDLIYVARYRAAASMTPLLSDLGMLLQEEIITPTVTATVAAPPQAPSITPPSLGPTEASSSLTPTLTPTSTPTLTPTSTPTSTPTPLASPTATYAATAAGTPTTLPEIGTPVATPVLTPARTPTVGPEIPQAPESTPFTLTVAPAPSVVQAPSIPVATAASPVPPASETPLTSSVAVTATATLTQSEAAVALPAAATPQVRLYLTRKDGIRLAADETQLFVLRTVDDDQKILAVLGHDEQAINSGLTRLLNRDFGGCLIQDDLIVCPVLDRSSASPPDEPIIGSTVVEPLPEGQPATAPDGSAQELILLVDDNRTAQEGELGEAEFYAAVLAAAGHTVDVWPTRQRGYPDKNKLAEYSWIIWSDAGYETSGIHGESLKLISALINEGAHVTISSRMPFFGVGAQPASPIQDLVVDTQIPELIDGLPTDPIPLATALPAVVPLEAHPEPSTAARIALRRGPASGSSQAPVLVVYSDEKFEDPQGALLMIFGMSITWLPDDLGARLVENMATVMLQE